MGEIVGLDGKPFGYAPPQPEAQSAPQQAPLQIQMSGDPETGLMRILLNSPSIMGEPLALLKIFNQCIGATLAFVEQLGVEPPDSNDVGPAESESPASDSSSPSPPALRLTTGDADSNDATNTGSATPTPPPLPASEGPPEIIQGEDGFSYCSRCKEKLGNCQCGMGV